MNTSNPFITTLLLLCLLFGQVSVAMGKTFVSPNTCTMDHLSKSEAMQSEKHASPMTMGYSLSAPKDLSEFDHGSMNCCESGNSAISMNDCCETNCQCTGMLNVLTLAPMQLGLILEPVGNSQISTLVLHTPKTFLDSFKRPPRSLLS